MAVDILWPARHSCVNLIKNINFLEPHHLLSLRKCTGFLEKSSFRCLLALKANPSWWYIRIFYNNMHFSTLNLQIPYPNSAGYDRHSRLKLEKIVQSFFLKSRFIHRSFLKMSSNNGLEYDKVQFREVCSSLFILIQI